MRTCEKNEYLDGYMWSDLWEVCLKQAEPFDPLSVHEIILIAPIPNQTGVLIFTDKKIYHSEENGLTTLQRYSAAHCFPHYKLICACLKALSCFGSYKFPWLCPYFALFPLENTQKTCWLNPLKISALHCEKGRYFAEILSGPNLLLPILRRSLMARAEITCYLLALVRRDFFHFTNQENTPLAYLNFPDTYFARLLSKRPGLAQFTHQIGEFTRHYNKVHFLYHYERLEDDPNNIDWTAW